MRGGGGTDGGEDGTDGGGDGTDGGGGDGGGALNHSCIMLGSLCLLGRRGLESLASRRTMEGLKGGTGGKGIARVIEIVVREEVEDGTREVDVGEDSV